MKNSTDLNQSIVLKGILPLKSADMSYIKEKLNVGFLYEEYEKFGDTILQDYQPAWSLAALQDIIKINYKLEKTFLDQSDYCTYSLYDSDEPTFRTFEYDNPVDACVEMIIKLREQNLL